MTPQIFLDDKHTRSAGYAYVKGAQAHARVMRAVKYKLDKYNGYFIQGLNEDHTANVLLNFPGPSFELLIAPLLAKVSQSV